MEDSLYLYIFAFPQIIHYLFLLPINYLQELLKD